MEKVRWQIGDPLQKILDRPSVRQSGTLATQVSSIINEIRKDGDEALRRMSLEYDNVELDSPKVSHDTIEMRADQLKGNEKAAIRRAYDNIMQFHSQQRYNEYTTEVMPGVVCERQIRPLKSVGLYVPGGRKPLFSSLLMQGVPAKIAGVGEIAVCHPFSDELDPAVAYSYLLVGAKKLYRLGGAQAITAIAIGTPSIEPVDKIFGPGNHYVSEAKKQVSQLSHRKVVVDMYAGPSEVLVLADNTARADFIAADMISQIEHGGDSWASLITDSSNLVNLVEKELEKQLLSMPNPEETRDALNNGQIVLVRGVEDMIELANTIAPEHLIIQTDRAESFVKDIEHAGSVFVGHFSPESAGDYASGTNHVLPTSGYARCSSGLTVESFQRTMTVQKLTQEGLLTLSDTVMTLARLEGLEGHARAVSVRTEGLEKTNNSNVEDNTLDE